MSQFALRNIQAIAEYYSVLPLRIILKILAVNMLVIVANIGSGVFYPK